MRVLMLGNNFTYYHDMPRILAMMTGWEVVSHARGGAYLSEHLDPEAELGQKTLPALKNERWDYVVLQEQSRAPYEKREQFLASVRVLCPLIRAAGAVPVLYSTWAYRDGSQRLTDTGLSYEAMLRALSEGYKAAEQENGALVAQAGEAFAVMKDQLDLYAPDDYHPSLHGSMLAAMTIDRCIRAHIMATDDGNDPA